MDSAAEKLSWLGSSLKVPSVQELVKKKPGSVPARYIIRSDDPYHQDPPISPIQYSSSSQEIPVIDLLRLLSGNSSELQKLDSACREWGFFQVKLIALILYIYTLYIIQRFNSNQLLPNPILVD